MIPKDKDVRAYRPKDAHIFIREGWLVTERHPDDRFCKLAKVFTVERDKEDVREPYVGVNYVHLKKYGPPAVTTMDRGELLRLMQLIEMEEGVSAAGLPLWGHDNE